MKTNTVRHHTVRSFAKIFGLALLTWTMCSAAGNATEIIEVTIDQTVPVKLEGGAKTVVVGNPSIADINVESGSLVFVLGRSFGTTNIFAVDSEGKEVANFLVQVRADNTNTVTMFKKTSRETMVCGDTCQHAPMIGDSTESFEAIVQEAQTKAEMAKGR